MTQAKALTQAKSIPKAGVHASQGKLGQLAECKDPAATLAQVLSDGTQALARFDAASLEGLQESVKQLQTELQQSGREPVWTPAAREEVEACRRIFAEVLRGTGRQLDLLKRMGSREKEIPWVR